MFDEGQSEYVKKDVCTTMMFRPSLEIKFGSLRDEVK